MSLQDYASHATARYQTLVNDGDTHDCVNVLLALKNNAMTEEPLEHDYDTHNGDSNQKQVIAKTPAAAHRHQNYDSDDISSPSLTEEHSEGSPIDDIESLLGKSTLVTAEDRDLVPDALFLAMAQMKPCTVTEADRVGCYKTREIGFVGLCCGFCGGQPGFGKFYPASVRSLAQTTTSQTILKHVAVKCRFCPPKVREAIVMLQKQLAIKEAEMAKGGIQRHRYGSRKVFFSRIWSRLHDEPIDITAAEKRIAEKKIAEKKVAARNNSRSVEEDYSSDESLAGKQQKHRFDGLPTKSNKRKTLSSYTTATSRPPKKRHHHVMVGV